jgi:hypothetical protein
MPGVALGVSDGVLGAGGMLAGYNGGGMGRKGGLKGVARP